jgi:hypothetical protein
MRRCMIALAALLCISHPWAAYANDDLSAYGPGKAFPFTAEDDHDGAMYVWFIICTSMIRYDYVSASELPQSKRFREVTDPRSGDIAWWPTYVAIFNGATGEYMTARGFFKDYERKPEFGPPKYYRLQVFDGEKTGERPWTECIPKR